MCLYVVPEKTEELRNDENWPKTCYKVLQTLNNELISPFVEHFWEVGVNESSRRQNTFPSQIDGDQKYKDMDDITFDAIQKGIHVFLTKESALVAKEFLQSMLLYSKSTESCVIVEVLCHKEHFVAAGNDCDAVFTEVSLSQKEYDRILKEQEHVLENRCVDDAVH